MEPRGKLTEPYPQGPNGSKGDGQSYNTKALITTAGESPLRVGAGSGCGAALWAVPAGPWHPKGSYLVDPASSHMLVSKIKPCMSKYKLLIL